MPLLFAVNACNDRCEPPKQVDPKEFNEKIENGVQAKAEWVKTPQSIVKELLPKTAFPEGNASYTVEENGCQRTLGSLQLLKKAFSMMKSKAKKRS